MDMAKFQREFDKRAAKARAFDDLVADMERVLRDESIDLAAGIEDLLRRALSTQKRLA